MAEEIGPSVVPTEELAELDPAHYPGEIDEAKQLLDLEEAILESLPDALVVCDDLGNIKLVNQQTELMFGYHRSEMIGQKIEMLLPKKSRDVHVRNRMKFFDEPRARQMAPHQNVFGQRKNGKEFAVEIMLGPIVTYTGDFTIAVVRRKSVPF